ncbi:MAG: cell wall hydrolase [Lachnospiraceae bacterium]|nr:cell wall hydrolase [Lachnospiraceae bacterium]
MNQKQKEVATGIVIGVLITLAFAVKVMAAPVTSEEANLLACTVQAEAGNQSFTGRRLVAAVVLNRVESPMFPDTVGEVLSQKGQFSTYSKLGHTKPTWQDRLAVQMEIEERSNHEVLFFNCGGYIPGTDKLMKYQDHYFSTIKK